MPYPIGTRGNAYEDYSSEEYGKNCHTIVTFFTSEKQQQNVKKTFRSVIVM
jgi:hypothetical protein